KRPLRIKQRRILRLADGEPRSIIHGDVLNCSQCLKTLQANIPHMRDIEDAYASANRIVLGNNASRGRVFDRHVPAIEFDHLRAHLAMNGVERGLAGWRGRLNSGQMVPRSEQWLSCRDGETHYPNMRMAKASTALRQ